MGLKTKPSETNKFVVKPDYNDEPKTQGYSFNAVYPNLKHISYSEEELFESLQKKLDSGWYQVSDIYKEEEQFRGRIRYDSGQKKVNPKRPRNKKKPRATVFFVYLSRNKPSILRKYKKAYKG